MILKQNNQQREALRGDVHTQNATPNVKSTFVGGWVLITDVLTWQFGDL